MSLPRQTPRVLPAAVYRHFAADGQLLYVGCSIDPLYRFGVHRSVSPWAFEVARIDVEWFADKEAALEAEARAIRDEGALHNGPRRTRKGTKRTPNLGHLYLRDWLDFSGTPLDVFAARAGISIKAARKFSSGPSFPQNEARQRIAVATEGYVPSGVWEAHWGPREFRRQTPEGAAKSLAYSQGLLDIWAAYERQRVSA